MICLPFSFFAHTSYEYLQLVRFKDKVNRSFENNKFTDIEYDIFYKLRARP